MKPPITSPSHRAGNRPGNRPGLSQIAYRMGDYASVRQRLLEQLPKTVKVLSHEPSAVSFAKLTTRADDDFAIALIDAWAVVTDVLTFYQERIANEGYLLTATERRSVLELARSIGYELDPGVAATTHLSFTVEDAPDAPTEANVPMGTQVMSVPIKDELPQTFETVEDLIAHVEWNAIKPRTTRAQTVDKQTRQLYLEGTNTQLNKGSLLLLVDTDNAEIAHVLILTAVQEEKDTEQTQVHWETALPPVTAKLLSPKVFTFEQVAHLFGSNAPDWDIMPEAVKLAALEKNGETIRGGIFHSKDNGQNWTAGSQGLPNSDILCLVARDQMLFAGTPDKGLFRSVDNGLTWEAANEGLTSQNVLALHMADKESIFNEALFAGTPNGGVFRSRDKGKNWVAINTGTLKTKKIEGKDAWEPVNTSLPNTVVRSILTCNLKGDSLGQFSSQGDIVTADNKDIKLSQILTVGDTVIAINQSRKVIQVTDDNSFEINHSFVTESLPAKTPFSAKITLKVKLIESTAEEADGEEANEENETAETEVSTDEGSETTNEGADNEGEGPPENTRTIESGDISSVGTNVTGDGTAFRELLTFAAEVSKRADVETVEIDSIEITALGQTRAIANTDGNVQIESDTELVTVEPFTRNELDAGTQLSVIKKEQNIIFVGTDEGVYYSTDQGRNWTTSESNQPNATQESTVYALEFIAGRNKATATAEVADRVLAGTDQGIWFSINGGDTWSGVWNQGPFQDQKVLSLTHANEFLFAGTAQGVYRRDLSSNSWETINDIQADTIQSGHGLESLAQQAINALATYPRGNKHYLFAATHNGIFVSENSQDNQVVWQHVSEQMTTQKATGIALDPSSKTLFSGTQFDGFTKPTKPKAQKPKSPEPKTSEPKVSAETTAETTAEPLASQQPAPIQLEWPNFALPAARNLDLDTLYPQILPGSWVVLFTDRHAQNPEQAIDPMASAHQVVNITTLDRSDFGISGNITRTELGTDITTPRNFGLRSTSVLIQSKPLAVAPEPLTVLKQQNRIFADPIAATGSLFLNELIPYLQPEQTVIVNGQHMRGQLTDVGGILRSQYQWQNHSKNLRNTVINALTTANNTLQFVGTDAGLYQWQGEAKPWKAIIALNYKVIHSLWQGGPEQNILLVGGDKQVYRSVDTGETWQILTEIRDTILQTVVAYTVKSIAPAITAISGTTLTLATPPESALQPGTIVTINHQHRAIAKVDASKNSLTVHTVFDPSLDGNYSASATGAANNPNNNLNNNSSSQNIQLLFAGTHQGLYRSLNAGKSWQPLTALSEEKVTALCTTGSSETPRLIVATDTGLKQSIDNGESWTPIVGQPQNILQLLPTVQDGQSRLWVGTTQGLYLYTFDQTSSTEATAPSGTWATVPSLRDRHILSLSSQGPILFAGTDQGIYRCVTGSPTHIPCWESIDAGLLPGSGRVLTTADNQLIAGTEEGIFSTADSGKRADPIRWGRNNTGLENTQVLSLAASSSGTEIVAGTTTGAFLSTNAGRSWQPLSEGLTPLTQPTPVALTTLFALTTDHTTNGTTDHTTRWYAGTAVGLFSWQPGDPSWTPQQSGLAYTDILALAQGSTQQTDGLLVGTRSGGLLAYYPNRSAGQQWIPTTLNNTDIQSIAVQGDRIFAGTLRDGLYRSTDGGTTWENITQTRAGRGSITSEDMHVTWTPTASSGAFGTLLQVGDTIVVQGQARSLVSQPVSQNQQITFRIDQPFSPNLDVDSPFRIETGLSNRNVTAIAITPQAIDPQATDPQPEEASQPLTEKWPLPIYAGTAGSGVFRSTDGGDRWQQIITNLDDLEIRCLMVEADQTLWAGTAQKGVFRSINEGNLWAPINHNLTNTDIQAIMSPAQKASLMVGGIGILISDDQLTTTPLQKNDIVQVVTPPHYSQELAASDALQNTNERPQQFEYHTWTIKDPLKQIQGTLRTPKQHPFPLLSADPKANPTSEVAIIQVPPTDQKRPVMLLQSPLKYSYDPATVSIHANIAKASHGETVEQVLGSGDGNQAYQQFTLSQPPLTHVPAAIASGAKSTLSLRVEGVLWEEVPSLYPLTPQDKNYIIRIEDDGTTRVSFGDGLRGARLPSGEENITATYRSGLGLAGNLDPRQLNILKTRPQSIVDVINPLAATGAADPERLEDARTKAPPTVRTLDRIVSLQDFEDFAQGFVGIGKAQATAIWNGATQLVHITLAGIEGAAVPSTSQLYQQLQQAIDQARDPIQQVLINSYDRQLFNVEARVLVDLRYISEDVLATTEAKLQQIFTFNKQQFGRQVTAAEVVAAIQSVAGVTAVDLDALYRVGESRELADELSVQPARYVVDERTRASELAPAQLLLINPLGIRISLVPAL